MLALRRLQQFLCTQDKSRLSCFAEWKLWWNLIHKLYLCIMVKDGSGEDLQTKAGSSFSRHIAVWCLWVVICARVSKKRQAAYTAQLGLCLHYVVPDWWCYEIEVTHPHVLALGITFCVEPWEGLFHAARRHFSHAQTGMHTHPSLYSAQFIHLWPWDMGAESFKSRDYIWVTSVSIHLNLSCSYWIPEVRTLMRLKLEFMRHNVKWKSVSIPN